MLVERFGEMSVFFAIYCKDNRRIVLPDGLVSLCSYRSEVNLKSMDGIPDRMLNEKGGQSAARAPEKQDAGGIFAVSP